MRAREPMTVRLLVWTKGDSDQVEARTVGLRETEVSVDRGFEPTPCLGVPPIFVESRAAAN